MPQNLPIEPSSQAVIDALPQHIAMLDQAGRIVAVNRAWRKFSAESGGASTGLGENYLEGCRELGPEPDVADGMPVLLIAGRQPIEFTLAVQ